MTIFIFASAVLAIAYGVFLAKKVMSLPEGDDKMKSIAHAIQEGAKAYLNRQYKTVAVVAALLFILIGLVPGLGWKTAGAFLVGAFLSALTGYIGMYVSVRANVRTAQAAKEISGLIRDSASKVEHGTHQAEKAGQSMNEIMAAISRLSTIVAGISAASVEQTIGIEQVNKAVAQMDEVTQQNAALVEQIAASAGGLRSQAQDLVQSVAVFQVEDGPAQRGIGSTPLLGRS